MSINFEINVFSDLVGKYKTWSELEKYLESDGGGLFRIIEKNENGLCIIRYEKGSSNMDLPHSKWFRSVIWNTNTNRPVCVAPQKSSSDNFTFSKISDLEKEGIVCQEFHEGFMINCFRMAGDKTLYITSRSKLDATGKFYSNRSFRDLFIEAYMNTLDSPFYNENAIQHNSSHMCSPNEENNEVSKFYSFLVQHTKHRIVKKNERNRVYLIHSGTVYSDGRVTLADGSETVFDGKNNLEKIVPSGIKTKSSYAEIASRSANESDNEVVAWIKNTLQEKNWEFQGLVFKDKNGNRWRFRSEKYAAVKALRGNSPSSIERFAHLYTQNLLSRYQEYYPEEAIHMLMGFTILESIVKKLYEHYVELHITKTKKAENIDKVFLPHLYNIHGIYLSQLKSNGKKVNLNEITLYLHKQPWQRIVFLIKKVSDGVLNN
jgi:hypothetical protein